MPHQVDVKAEPRTVIGRHLNKLRSTGYVPANVYGPGMESIPIQLESKTFHEVVRHATPATLINLTIGAEGPARKVYLRDIQWQFTKHEPFHVDFYAVNLDRPVRNAVPIVLRGDAPATHANSAILLHPQAQVHVEGLPANLPETIEVDVSGLTQIDQAIYARDLTLPSGVTLIDDPEELIVKVQLVRAAVEEAAEEAAAEAPAEQPAPTEQSEGSG